MAGFFFNEEYSSPDAIDRRRALINALSKENLSTAPVGHWTSALARVVGAGADQYETARLNEQEKKATDENKRALMAAFGLGGAVSPGVPTAAAGVPPSSPAAAPSIAGPVPQQTLMPNRPQMPEGPNIFERVGSMIPEAMGQEAPKPSPFGTLNQPQSSNPTPLIMQSEITRNRGRIGMMPVNPSLGFSEPGPRVSMAALGGGSQMAAAPGQPSERDLVIRTIAAETSGKSPQEAQAIAAVILNRAKTRGLSPADVVLERNQFEPWNAGPGGRNDPMNIDPNSPRYQQASQALAAAVAGQDPTGGATHFFAPRAQAALGRNAPAWAQGPGQQIGATAFYAPEGRAPSGPVPVGDMPAKGAQTAEQPMQRPAPGQFVNPMQGGGQAAGGINPQAMALMQALSSPWAAKNPMLAQLGARVLGEQMTGNKLQYQTLPDGTILALDPTGRRSPTPVYQAPTKPRHGIIAEDEYGNKQYGWIDDVNRTVTPTGTSPIPPTSGPPAQSGQGQTPVIPPAPVGSDKKVWRTEQTKKLAEGDTGEKKFRETMGKEQADYIVATGKDGDAAAQDIQTIGELRKLGDRIGTGGGAVIRQRLGEFGIKFKGSDDIEAYTALLNRLTPQQRVPGSGATSDFDAKMFRDSLPRLINTPEGNKLVLDTMERLAQNRMARADIANKVQTGELSRQDGMKQLSQLQADARKLSESVKTAAAQPTAPPASAGQPRTITRDQYQSLPSGSKFIAADDPTKTVRTKP